METKNWIPNQRQRLLGPGRVQLTLDLPLGSMELNLASILRPNRSRRNSPSLDEKQASCFIEPTELSTVKPNAGGFSTNKGSDGKTSSTGNGSEFATSQNPSIPPYLSFKANLGRANLSEELFKAPELCVKAALKPRSSINCRTDELYSP